MINRALIRIKVAQMLYSYLLTRSEFGIEPAPEKKTRDSRYAYTVYLQTLLLILRLTGRSIAACGAVTVRDPLKAGEVAKALSMNNNLREAVTAAQVNLGYFDESTIEHLADQIRESAAWRDFSKKKRKDLSEEVAFWCLIIETIFARDEKLRDNARRDENFTIAGFQKGIEMAVATLRDYNDVNTTFARARKSLQESLERAYQLYVAILLLPVEITRMRESQIEAAKEKYIPTADDLNPNLKFIDNKLVNALRANKDLEKYLGEPPLSIDRDYYLIKKLLEQVLESEAYAEYMADPKQTLMGDCEFWRGIIKDIIIPSDDLAEALESKSVYWNDDLNTVGAFVLKSIRRYGMSDDEGSFTLMPMFKDQEDAEFGEKLFIDSIEHSKDYRELIDRFINEAHWDTERLAFMDIVILTTAISEILNFPAIPIAVSLNEYIEIANYYSNPRSGQFINGILYSVVNYLRQEGKLHKTLDAKPREPHKG